VGRGARPPEGSTQARWLGQLAPAVLAVALGAPAAAQGDPGWDVRVPERIDVALGATAPLSIAIAVDRGLTVSKDAAVILDLAPDAGVWVKKRRLGRADAMDPDADAPRFVVPLRGDVAGDHLVRLRLRFWLCGARACRPIDVRRTATMSVAAQTPRPDAGMERSERGMGAPTAPLAGRGAEPHVGSAAGPPGPPR
jgi:hypothetical protein